MNQELIELIAATKGKFFSITFIKKDGTERTANGKALVKRLLKGEGDAPRATGHVSFVDRNKDGWIAAKGERVKHFKCGKIEKTFVV